MSRFSQPNWNENVLEYFELDRNEYKHDPSSYGCQSNQNFPKQDKFFRNENVQNSRLSKLPKGSFCKFFVIQYSQTISKSIVQKKTRRKIKKKIVSVNDRRS